MEKHATLSAINDLRLKERVQFTSQTSLGMAVLAVLFIIFQFTQTSNRIADIVLGFSILLLGSSVYIILDRGYAKMAFNIFIYGFYMILAVSSIYWGGFTSFGFPAFGTLLIITALLKGKRGLYIISFLTILSTLIIYITQRFENFEPAYNFEPSTTEFFFQLILVWLFTTIILRSNQNMFDSILELIFDKQNRIHEMEEVLIKSKQSEVVDRISGSIAHDVNNLLMKILTESENGNKKTDNPEIEQHFGKIITHVKHGKSITQRLLSYSSKRVLKREILSAQREIERISVILQNIISEDKNLNIQLESQEDTISIDRGDFEQIILNIVLNASDAGAENTSIEIKTENIFTQFPTPCAICEEHDLEEMNFVGIKIKDYDGNLNDERLSDIFEPFVTQKEGGTGLGLSIVKRIIQRNDGHIYIKNMQESTSFEVYLPLHDKTEENNGKKLEEIESSMTVLLVDDEPGIRFSLSRGLELHGHDVTSADNGDVAIDLIQNCDYDLIISDIIMPNGSGLDLYQWVRDQGIDIPFILMSGFSEHVQEVKQQNYDIIFLEKPFSINELLATIENFPN